MQKQTKQKNKITKKTKNKKQKNNLEHAFKLSAYLFM